MQQTARKRGMGGNLSHPGVDLHLVGIEGEGFKELVFAM